MNKKFVASFCLLCFLLASCSGNDNEKKINGQENLNVDYSQTILFVLSDTSYANEYENKGYFVLGDGSKCFFDLSDEDRNYANIENLYQYLSSHLSEFERIEYLSPEETVQCMDYLYEIEERSEIKKDTNYVADAGQSDLYGVRFVSDMPEFVMLKGEGCQCWERSDENVEKIIGLFGEEWADDSDYLRRRRKALEYEFSGDEVVAMLVNVDITGKTDTDPAILLVYADGAVEAGFGDYGEVLTESGLKRQSLENYIAGRSYLGNLGNDERKRLLSLICNLDTKSPVEDRSSSIVAPCVEPTRQYYRYCVQWSKEGATYVKVNQGNDQKGFTSQLKDEAAKRAVELVVDGAFMEAWYDMQY
ncbi:MAG: hypothetical protein IKT67_11625 [Lachnospiraceae bacterium]|nr:hypothetical protein [Lachnospiraceae bacterium]